MLNSERVDVYKRQLYTALSVAFPAERIYFHGNNKSDEELRYALEQNIGCIVAVSYTHLMISLTIMAVQTNAQAAGDEVYQYVLKNENNRIAVYERGKEEPVRVLDYPVDSLPYMEQSALENGIPVKDQSELQKMIEDFTG